MVAVPAADGLIVTSNAPVGLLAGTVTVAGTVAMDVLLLASETVAPPVGVRAVTVNVAEVRTVPVWTVAGLRVRESSAPPGCGGGGAGTVIVAGTVTAAVLLLENATTAPPLGAGAVSVTVADAVEPPSTLAGLRLTVSSVALDAGGAGAVTVMVAVR